MSNYQFGIRANLGQFNQQLLQVFWVGMTLGLMRTVVPALAEAEFDVPRNSFMLLTMFVVAFGFVKGAMNFVAGRLSEKVGRKKVLVMGWIIALPIPLMIYFAPSWNWIVAATVLLGINQGLTWSMTQTSKLDMTHQHQRGLTVGFNEFAGYVGVAVAGVVTAYVAEWLGVREGLLWMGSIVILIALITAVWQIKDTLPWAHHEIKTHVPNAGGADTARALTTYEAFALVIWKDKRMQAFSQAGLVEKFVDALVWVFYPLYLMQNGATLTQMSWIIGIYGTVWGMSQFLTGKLSDHVGRLWPIVIGMWVCGIGVLMMLFFKNAVGWSISAAVAGFGMALLYPNLSAAISDIAHPKWRGSAIGTYRFWRDTGYGIGALALGWVAQHYGQVEAGFWMVGIAMLLSGLWVLVMAEETLPAKVQQKAAKES